MTELEKHSSEPKQRTFADYSVEEKQAWVELSAEGMLKDGLIDEAKKAEVLSSADMDEAREEILAVYEVAKDAAREEVMEKNRAQRVAVLENFAKNHSEMA